MKLEIDTLTKKTKCNVLHLPDDNLNLVGNSPQTA